MDRGLRRGVLACLVDVDSIPRARLLPPSGDPATHPPSINASIGLGCHQGHESMPIFRAQSAEYKDPACTKLAVSGVLWPDSESVYGKRHVPMGRPTSGWANRADESPRREPHWIAGCRYSASGCLDRFKIRPITPVVPDGHGFHGLAQLSPGHLLSALKFFLPRRVCRPQHRAPVCSSIGSIRKIPHRFLTASLHNRFCTCISGLSIS